MIKKNKILIFAITLIITLFIGCNNVFALKTYTEGQLYKRAAGASKSEVSGFAYNVKDKSDSASCYFLLHYGTPKNGGSQERLYCLDASLDATVNDLKVDKVLNPYNPQDAALLYIMTKSGNDDNTYKNKVTAVRVLNQFTDRYNNFRTYSSDHVRGKKLSYAYINTGIEWLPNMKGTADVFKTNTKSGLQSLISAKSKGSAGWGTIVPFSFGQYVLNESDGYVSGAKALVAEAIEYASNVSKRFELSGKDKVKIVLVSEKGKNYIEDLTSGKAQNGVRDVKDTVYFIVRFDNYNYSVYANEAIKVSNDTINGFTIAPEYKVVDEKTKLRDLKGSNAWKKLDGNTNLVASIIADAKKTGKNSTYIAFKYTLTGKLTGSTGVTLKVNTSARYAAILRTGAYLVPTNNALSQRFLVADSEPEVDQPGLQLPITFNLLGVVCEEPKTFKTHEECETYINTNKDGNSTFDEAWCNDKTLYCTPQKSCKDYEGNKYKDHGITTCENALKDLNGKSAPDAAYAQCIGEKKDRLICDATCDSLVGEFQTTESLKGSVGVNTLKAILGIYDSLKNNDPKEAEKVKLNEKYNHAVCHTCEDYSGKTLAQAGFSSFEELEKQVNDPTELYLIDGVIYCSVNYCESTPDTNNVDQYRNWIRKCCRKENKRTSRDYNVEEACENGDEEACKTYQNYCSICDPDFDINNTCVELDPGENAKVLTPEEYTADNKGSIKSPENVKLCVIDEATTEKNKNEYKLSKENNVNDNPYCSVFCKEDMDFEIPKGRYTINGRHFTLSMQVNATKTCYSNKIDYAKFESDYNTYKAQADRYASNPNSKEFKNAQQALSATVNYINACSAGWSNDYKYEPDIEFTYDEKEYIDMLPNKSLTFELAKPNDEKIESWFCTGNDVNNEYTQCIGGNGSNAKTTKTVTQYLENGTTEQVTVPQNITYAKKSIVKGGLYTPKAVFYTKASTGVIKYSEDGKKLINYALIEDKTFAESKGLEVTGTLPVRLKDGRGLYNYQFSFDNFGEYFDRDEVGRLISSKSNSDINNINNEFKGKYVCSYVVNCPNCKPSCVDDPAKGIVCSLPDTPETCPEEGCDIKCSEYGCAYDPNYGLLYTVHQTSLIDLTNKDRTVGTNWDPNVNVKAQAAIEEIESKGEDIYKEPEYEFEFTPAVITYLRKNSGNYVSDETLKCSTKTVGNKSYLVCDSSVLTELKEQFSAQTHLDGRKKIQSFLDSDFCKNQENNNVCALVGTIGPAWK